MNRRHVIIGLLGLLFLLVGKGSIFARNNDSVSVFVMDSIWRSFRQIHPFSYQTVGLAHYKDTSVFVISEPSRWVNNEELKKLFSRYGGEIIVRQQPFGYDGYLTDVIGCAKLTSKTLDLFKSDLFKLLYYTDYKAFFIDLDEPSEHIYYSKNLNLSFGTDDIVSILRYHHDWFNYSSKNQSSLVDILVRPIQSSNSLFFSKKPGVIAWVIDTETVRNDSILFRQNAYKFGLDTDLIIGGIRLDINRIVVFGRERELPICILSPLRPETIVSLCSMGQQLGLCFESGKALLIEDSCFATPITMSHLLCNTELANLFTITDIMLKSWSENGIVNDNYIAYPAPVVYPYHNGVASKLGYTPKYLWGSGTEIEELQTKNAKETITLISAGRTNCPLIYYPNTHNNSSFLSSDTLRMYTEMECREYFAWLNNTDLTRCLQYITLYQMFRTVETNGMENRESILSLNEIPNNAWIKTPTHTVSNHQWGCGGHYYPGKPKNYLKLLEALRGKPKTVRRVVPRPKGVTSKISSIIDIMPGRDLQRPISMNAHVNVTSGLSSPNTSSISTVLNTLPENHRVKQRKERGLSDKHLQPIKPEIIDAKTKELEWKKTLDEIRLKMKRDYIDHPRKFIIHDIMNEPGTFSYHFNKAIEQYGYYAA